MWYESTPVILAMRISIAMHHGFEMISYRILSLYIQALVLLVCLLLQHLSRLSCALPCRLTVRR